MRQLLSLFLTALTLSAQPGSAQPEAPQNTSLDLAALRRPVRVIKPRPRIGIMSEVELTLDQAVASVLANNRDIESSRIDRLEAGLRLTGARGVYDPRFVMEPAFAHTTSPVSSTLGGGSIPGELRQTNLSATPQITGNILNSGGTYTVSFSSARNSTDNTFATLNPQYPTTLTFSAVQPLFKNLRYDDNRRQITVAKKNLSISDEQFRQKVIQVTTQAVEGYWDLVYAVRNLQIQVEAVDLARKQVESNQRQEAQGILAPIDIVQAENQLDTFEQNIYSAQQALTQAENVLKALMLQNRSSPLWTAALIPVTPLNLDPPELDYAPALDEALRSRPELAQVKLSADVAQANTRYLHEQTKPQADLVVSYSASGLSGKALTGGPNPLLSAGTVALTNQVNLLSQLAGIPPLPPTSSNVLAAPPFLVGGYAQSLSNLTAWTYPGFNASVRISVPLRNRTAVSNFEVGMAEERRIENQRQQLEIGVETDVRNTMQAIDSTKARMDAAVLARQSSEAQYQSELRQFQEGTSTVFLVLQRQTTMITARNTELRAQTDMSKAIADFERATTRTIAVRKITLQ
jgi:HAE1 family hydrophobic/amphiphilic exporter-1